VEIGAGCAIDRAAIGATRIGAGSKFSNLVAIGHGTQIGKHNLLVAQVGIAGSVTVGDYCVFAGQAGVVGHLTIGDFVRVGAQAGVTSDIPAKSEMLGSPAVPLSKARRNVVLHKQLPEIRETVRRLERQVAELTEQMQRLTGQSGKTDDQGSPG
jgi:UDP-3-O-[3-hydroxymyristoyl] glucosamine N-acyltransferase